MPAMTIQELFAEANGLQHHLFIPSGLVDLIDLLSKFCINNDLEWGIEQGYAFPYCVFIARDIPNGWCVEIEANNIKDAIVMVTVEAWQRLTTPDNVFYLEEWKQRLR